MNFVSKTNYGQPRLVLMKPNSNDSFNLVRQLLRASRSLNLFGLFKWEANTRGWSTDRTGTDLVEGAD